MVAFFNPLISFLSIYTYCTSEMLPKRRAAKSKLRYFFIIQWRADIEIIF
jgi:hypothetical protein